MSAPLSLGVLPRSRRELLIPPADVKGGALEASLARVRCAIRETRYAIVGSRCVRIELALDLLGGRATANPKTTGPS